jgi:peptidoglycan/xylan/chitin deacetylase (PgdA/CDA1 family)
MNKYIYFITLMKAMTGNHTILLEYQKLSLPEKTIIFTFDDGPNSHSNVTQNILLILRN